MPFLKLAARHRARAFLSHGYSQTADKKNCDKNNKNDILIWILKRTEKQPTTLLRKLCDPNNSLI